MSGTYSHTEAVGFAWSIADLLRGTYKADDYGDIIRASERHERPKLDLHGEA